MSLEEQLITAVRGNNIEEVRSLLKKGADVNVKDSNGHTPLHLAAIYGHTEIAKLFLDRGANIEAQNRTNETPLHLAARNGYTETVNLLLNQKATVDAKNCFNETPLFLAAKNNRKELVSLLLITYKVNVNAQNTSQKTPLHIAIEERHEEVAIFLIENGADIHAKNRWGSTPLHDAAFNGLGNLVKLLLDRGANVHIQSIYKETPLHKVVHPNADPQTVRLLLEHGSDVNTKGNHGRTLISSYITWEKPLETFFLLLLYGTNIGEEEREKINEKPKLASCLAAFEEIKALPHLGKLIEANIKGDKEENAKAIASYINNEVEGQELSEEFKTIKEKYGSDEQLSFVSEHLFSLIKKIGLEYKISKEFGEKVISGFLAMQGATGADDISAVIASDLSKNDIMNVAFSNEQSYKALKPLNKLMTELKDICKMPNTALAAAQSEAVPSQSRYCIS